MKFLEDRILKEGKIINGDIIKVDSFLNHQLDIDFLNTLSKFIRDYFKDRNINKILTIEASGIALATLVSQNFGGINVVFAKKKKTLNISDDIYSSKVSSFTTKRDYEVCVSKEYLNENDNILIIDDFLSEGNALKGLIDISNKAHAKISGISVAIEKGYLNGGKIIRSMGYDLLSLAKIKSIEEGRFKFDD